MEEVIKKSDGQFKDILDEIVDYSKHESKKDPLIKELNRSKLQQNPSSSLNSSTYSSAASSLSASSSSTSSNSSSSSSASISSSTSSSPKTNTTSNQEGDNSAPARDGYNNNVEIPKMQELGKTAKILEHRFLPSSVYLQSANERFSNFNTNANLSSATNAASSSNHKYTLASDQYVVSALSEFNTPSANTWRTINGKRDKRRRKPIEKKILAGEIPGNIGRKSIEELENFIKSGTNGPVLKQKNNKNNRFTNVSNSLNSNNQSKLNPNINQTTKKSENNTNIRSQSAKMTSNHHINNSLNQEQNQQQQSRNVQLSAHQNFQQQQQTIQEIPKSIDTMPAKRTSPTADDQINESQIFKENTKKVVFQHAKPIVRDNSMSRINQQQNRQTHSTKQLQPQQQQLKQKQQQQERIQPSTQTDKPDAVTFANHLHFKQKDDVSKIEFGFFSEKPEAKHSCVQGANKMEDHKLSKTMPSKSSASVVAFKRQTNITIQPQTREYKQKPKQFKASRNSEESFLKSKQEANSFNYEQVLKYISKAWKDTQNEEVSTRNR